MAFDEDAVVEALARLQPTLDAMQAEIDALKSSGGGSGTVPKVVKYTAELDDGTTRVFELIP